VLEGRVVPVLGAGVNVCERPPDAPKWTPGCGHLPWGWELAKHLAAESAYEPNRFKKRTDGTYERVYDLVSVSQYVEAAKGDDSLHRVLHEVFKHEHTPTVVHRFLARLAKVVSGDPLLMLTTNYDYALEQALRQAAVPYDLVTYVSDVPAGRRGDFMHSVWDPKGGESKPLRIRGTKRYVDLLRERPVIVKIHGAVRPGAADHREDNYVITEDDYIDFLVHQDPRKLLPVGVTERLPGSHFLFLGYALRDWNLRVLLRRIWDQRSRRAKSWSVRLEADPLEADYITTLRYKLPAYVYALRRACVEDLLDSFMERRGDSARALVPKLEALLQPLSTLQPDAERADWEALVRGLSNERFTALSEAVLRDERASTLDQALLDEVRRRARAEPPAPHGHA
jgi:SIR2-like domain